MGNELGTAAELDPGVHEVVAAAPGHVTFFREIVLREGETRFLELDELAPSPVAASAKKRPHRGPTALPKRSESTSSGPPTATWALAGLSITSIAVGTGFGVASLGENGDAEAACPDRVGLSLIHI